MGQYQGSHKLCKRDVTAAFNRFRQLVDDAAELYLDPRDGYLYWLTSRKLTRSLLLGRGAANALMALEAFLDGWEAAKR